MTQAEQVMLRYNYLMQLTAQQQGDWARTSMTWANQLRLLQLNIQSLASTIGQGLIAAVLPALQALNVLMSVLQRAAEAFRDFMYVLTGYKPQSSGGIVNDLAGIGDTASDLGDLGFAGDTAAGGLDDATSAAEDLKKALSVLSFDELNQLSDTSVPDASTPSSGSGGGGAGGLGGGSGLGGLDSITDALGKSELPEAINEWAERIRKAFLNKDWDKLGEEIAWGINKGMQAIYDAINWENVGPKITAFTSAFTQTMNSLVDHIDWDLMGKTVGAGVNTIVNTLNQLIEGFDFVNLGVKLSEGLRGAISEIQWTNLGNLLGNYFMISWNMLSGFISGMAKENGAGLTGWEELGIALGNAFNGIFQKIDFGVIGTTIANGINGLFEIIKNFTLTVNWDELAINIYTGINNMINGINWAEAGATLSLFVTNLLGTFARVAQNTDWEGLGRGIGEFLSNIDWITIIGQVGTILWEVFSGVLSGLFDTKSGKVIIGFVAGLTAVKGAFKIVDIASSAIEWVTGIKRNLSKIIPFFTDTLSPGIANGVSKIAGEGGILSKLATGAKSAVSLASKAFGGILGVVGVKGLVIAGIIAGVVLIITNWDKIKETASKVKDWVVEKWKQLTDYLSRIPDKIGEIVNNIADWFDELPGRIGEAIGFVAGKIARWVLDMVDTVKTEVPKIIESVVSFFKELPGKIGDAISSAVTSIKEWATDLYNTVIEEIPKIPEKVIEFFSELPEKIKEIGENLITGFLDGIQSLWSDVKDGVGDFVDGVIRGFEEGFDTHSPSRITEGIGENVGKGLINGIDNQSNDALRTVQYMSDQIIDRMQNAMDGMMDNLDYTMRQLQYTLDDAQRNADNSAWSIQNAFSNLYIPLPHIGWDWNYIDFGDFSFSIPSFKIRWYAKGGLFTKATLAGIGEAGKEAVLPLENRRTMSMIADSIMESGNIGVDEETLANAVAQGVAMAMMNNQGNQTPITVYAELKTESDEVLARAVTRGQQKIDYRNNPTIRFGY